MVIPFSASSVLGQANGLVVKWNQGPKQFTVSPPLGGGFVGGTFKVGENTWTIQSISGSLVTVSQVNPLGFILTDDDQSPYPFPVNLDLLQESSVASENLLAQAYIMPVSDIPNGPKVAAFNRNLRSVDPPLEYEAALQAGRDGPQATPSYWATYLQGAFQGDEELDGDPQNELYLLGATGGLTFQFGSLVFVETIRDVAMGSPPPLAQVCGAFTAAHELGHQFGATDGPSGVMGSDCFSDAYFTGPELATIRSKIGP